MYDSHNKLLFFPSSSCDLGTKGEGFTESISLISILLSFGDCGGGNKKLLNLSKSTWFFLALSWATKFPHSPYRRSFCSLPYFLIGPCYNSLFSFFLDPLFTKDEWNENVHAISSEDRKSLGSSLIPLHFCDVREKKSWKLKRKTEEKYFRSSNTHPSHTWSTELRNYACLWVCDRSPNGSKRERKYLYINIYKFRLCKCFFFFLSRTCSSLEFECLHTIDTWIFCLFPIPTFLLYTIK